MKVRFCLILLSMWIANPIQADINISVSIKPLHSLVAAITDGVNTPTLIVNQNSIHHGSLKPSQIKSILRSDLAVWVGLNMENNLVKVITEQYQGRVITVSEIKPEKLRHFDSEEDHDHDHGHDHEATENESHIVTWDPHLWLDVELMSALVNEIVITLVEIDPLNAEKYTSNGKMLTARLDALTKTLDERLSGSGDRVVFVDHDAYGYLADKYEFTSIPLLNQMAENSVSIDEITAYRQQMEEKGVRCLLADVHFSDRLINTIQEDRDVTIKQADLSGYLIEPGQELYFKLMNTLSKKLHDCFQ